MINVQDIFSLSIFSIVLMGAYCAYKLDDDYPLLIRLLILSPVFGSLCLIYHISIHLLVADMALTTMAISTVCIYMVIVFLLSSDDSNFLIIKYKKKRD